VASGMRIGAPGKADPGKRVWPYVGGPVDFPRPSPLRRLLISTRSVVALAVIAIVLGIAMAASLGYLIFLLAQAIHHAASS
jgi:hypothetical protein